MGDQVSNGTLTDEMFLTRANLPPMHMVISRFGSYEKNQGKSKRRKERTRTHTSLSTKHSSQIGQWTP